MCWDLKGCSDLFLQIILDLTLETRVLITLTTYLHGCFVSRCLCLQNQSNQRNFLVICCI